MLGWAGKLARDPGWRLRCIDPPIAWLCLRRAERTEIGVRIQLTCYLSSKRAQPVRIAETRLVLRVDGGQIVIPSTGVTDVGGRPFPELPGHTITGYETEHALVDYSTDDPVAVGLLRDVGPPVALVVEALVNTSRIQRKIATFDLIHDAPLSMDGGWTQIGTGR